MDKNRITPLRLPWPTPLSPFSPPPRPPPDPPTARPLPKTARGRFIGSHPSHRRYTPPPAQKEEPLPLLRRPPPAPPPPQRRWCMNVSHRSPTPLWNGVTPLFRWCFNAARRWCMRSEECQGCPRLPETTMAYGGPAVEVLLERDLRLRHGWWEGGRRRGRRYPLHFVFRSRPFTWIRLPIITAAFQNDRPSTRVRLTYPTRLP